MTVASVYESSLQTTRLCDATFICHVPRHGQTTLFSKKERENMYSIFLDDRIATCAILSRKRVVVGFVAFSKCFLQISKNIKIYLKGKDMIEKNWTRLC